MSKLDIKRNLALVLAKFPLRLSPDEEKYEGLAYKNDRPLTVTFDSGSPIQRWPSNPRNLAAAIPSHIEEAIKEHDSIRNFVFKLVSDRKNAELRSAINRKNYKPLKHTEYETRFKSFDTIPLAELPPTRTNINPARLEAYLRRRVIFSLTKICAIEPKIYFDNKLFLKWINLEPSNPKSNYYKALQIEPCLLQTEIGTRILRTGISFWNKEQSQALSIALKTRNVAEKKGRITNETITAQLTQTLLMIETFYPDAFELTDMELQSILIKHRVLPKVIDDKRFGEIRRLIHRKKG